MEAEDILIWFFGVVGLFSIVVSIAAHSSVF